MITRRVGLVFGKGRLARIGVTGDWHVGNRGLHIEGINRFVARTVRQRMPWLHLGDIIEAILPPDPRYAADSKEKTLYGQCQDATDIIKKARDYCWGLVVGNHELRVARLIGNITAKIAADVNCPYLGGAFLLTVACDKGGFSLFGGHGGGGMGSKIANAQDRQRAWQRALRRIVFPFPGDVRVLGHYHRSLVAPITYQELLQMVDGKVRMRPKADEDYWAATCPAMWKAYEEDEVNGVNTAIPSYAEARLMWPTQIGWLEIVVNRNGMVEAIEEITERGELRAIHVPITVRT